MTQKICTKCKKEKVLSDFYLRKDKMRPRNECKDCIKIASKKRHTLYPWRRNFYTARSRCTEPKNKDFKYYGAKGIKFLLTIHEIKFLWFRDNAYLMKIPTLDRINSTTNYELKNCRFLEFKANRAREKCFSKPVLQYSKDGQLLNEFNSIKEASRATHTEMFGLSQCAKEIYKTANKFIWKFKNV